MSATGKNTPNPFQQSLHSFFQAKENTAPNSNDNEVSSTNQSILKEAVPSAAEPVKKRTMFQCDYCREAVYETYEEAVRHEETCDARKPAAEEKTKQDSKTNDEAKKSTKKRRKSKIPDPIGPLTVNVSFNDSTEEMTIRGVCTDVFGDKRLTLNGDFPKESKRAIKNFLSGFGKFVW
jgi:hypothetical protein